MMNRLLTILIFSFWSLAIHSQEPGDLVMGTVTFVSSDKVYVKFNSTKDIIEGDTLIVSNPNGFQPCLIVQNKSSNSVVCNTIFKCELQQKDLVFFRVPLIETNEPGEVDEDVTQDARNELMENLKPVQRNRQSFINKQRINSRVSVASYSNFSQQDESLHRMMYRINFNGSNISNSRISLEANVNYRHHLSDVSTTSSRLDGVFRFYNAAIKYEKNNDYTVWLGRKINPYISNLGAIDGLQIQKQFQRIYIGIISGFRPDFQDYGLNFDLFENGIYVGYKKRKLKNSSQTTLGILEQRNSGSIDRRFLYFQHSSTFNRKINLFASFDADIYKKLNGISETSLRLTNLYINARYRFNKKINLSLSYDNRKNVIYYETYKSDIDRFLDDEARQGVRARLNIKPIKFVNIGISYSYRFQLSSINKSNNFNMYLNWSRLPGIGGSASINFNFNKTNYLDGKIYAFRHYRDLISGKLSAELYFRYVDYTYLTFETKSTQEIFGSNLSYRFNRNFALYLFGEITMDNNRNLYRINTKVINRF